MSYDELMLMAENCAKHADFTESAEVEAELRRLAADFATQAAFVRSREACQSKISVEPYSTVQRLQVEEPEDRNGVPETSVRDRLDPWMGS
jgi:hypothetical protein